MNSGDEAAGAHGTTTAFFMQLAIGKARMPTRPRRTALVPSDALRQLWPWAREQYYYGIGDSCAVVSPNASADEHTATGTAASFQGLYYPDSLLTLRSEPQLGPGQVGVVASELIPYGTCFVYGGQLVQYVEAGAKAEGAQPQPGKRGRPASRHVTGTAPEGSTRDAGYFCPADRTYEFGLSDSMSVLGGTIARAVNHRYGFSPFGNVQFTTVTLPASVQAIQPVKKKKVATRVVPPLDGGGDQRKRVKTVTTRRVSIPAEACSFVPFFLCTADIGQGEPVVAASYGEGYDSRLERHACASSLALTGDEAFVLRALEEARLPHVVTMSGTSTATSSQVAFDASVAQPAKRSSAVHRTVAVARHADTLRRGALVSPVYTADYRYAVDRGSIVAMRRWVVGGSPAEADRWRLLESTTPDLARAEFYPAVLDAGAPLPYSMYLFVVRSTSFPRDGRAGVEQRGVYEAPVSDWLVLLQPLPVVPHAEAPLLVGNGLEPPLGPRETLHRVTTAGAPVGRCVVSGALGLMLLDDLEYDLDAAAGYVRIHASWIHAVASGGSALYKASLGLGGSCSPGYAAAGLGPGADMERYYRTAPSHIPVRSGAVWPAVVGSYPSLTSDFAREGK
jgi:hypothetical protein